MPDGSMICERRADGSFDRERHWWVQAECVVGLTWLYTFHGAEQALELAGKTWRYIRTHLVDPVQGEWFWSVRADGTGTRRGFGSAPTTTAGCASR